MRRNIVVAVLLVATGLVGSRHAFAGQAPTAAYDPDIPISHQDRVYSAEQYSNTVSVTDPVDNKLVGTIRLGDPLPANLSPLYRGQLLVHGMGFSPDHRTIAVVAIGSNAVNFIDTATNSVKHVTYVGRSPHEAFYTMDGHEVWVVVRGEKLRIRARWHDLRGEDADHRPQWSGHDDLLARWQIRLRLFLIYTRDRSHHRRRSQNCRQGSASKPVLS